MQEKTIYTAKEGERITSVKTIDNSIVITIEPEKKTWRDYESRLGYIKDTCIDALNLPTLFNIALTIMDDLNGDWKPNWNNECENKYFYYIHDTNNICVCSNTTLHQSIFYFKSKALAEQFVDICGKEFIFKLYGRG